jgi:hypothetical protein
MKRIVIGALAALMPLVALAHGGHKHVQGTIASVTANAIDVKGSDGHDTSVALTPATKFFHGADTTHPAALADLKPGERVVVHLGADGKALEVHVP